MIMTSNSKDIRNVWGVGRNYGAHAKEMGADIPTTPMIFLKAGSTVTFDSSVTLFQGSSDIHHEIEIALRFGSQTDSTGRLLFDRAALALDLTARDLQAELKKRSHPWTLAKSFRESCPMSAAIEISNPPPRFQFELHVNGEIRQRGDTDDMIFGFEQLRLYVLEAFPVVPGDWLLTGTPEGVAGLKPGDVAKAHLTTSLGPSLSAEWRFQ